MSRISYYTKLSGTSFHQKELAKVKPGVTKLRCIAHEDNEYDQYAVEVQALIKHKKMSGSYEDWEQIGWIPKGHNEDIWHECLEGGIVEIICSDITGGVDGKENLGCNVGITYGKDDSVAESLLPTFDKEKVIYGDADYIYFDADQHMAYDLEGHVLRSGSQIEEMYRPKVNFEYPAKAIAKSTGVKKEDVLLVWDNNKELSAEYGTLVHKALQYYYDTHDILENIDEKKEREFNLRNWMPHNLAEIVIDFINASGVKEAETEVRVKYGRMTGIIDNLQKTDGGFIINDYKVTSKLGEVKYEHYGKMLKYTIQQNVYRQILEGLGYKVKAMYLWQWDGTEWTKHEVKPVEVEL